MSDQQTVILIGGTNNGRKVSVFKFWHVYYTPKVISLEESKSLEIDGEVAYRHPEEVYYRTSPTEFTFNREVNYKP